MVGVVAVATLMTAPYHPRRVAAITSQVIDVRRQLGHAGYGVAFQPWGRQAGVGEVIMTVIVRTRLLRHALRLDAIVSGATGALLWLGAGPLSGPLGLPHALLTGAGVFCVVYALGLAVLARRADIPRPLAMAVVAGNIAWVAASLWLPVSEFVEPTLPGTAFVVVQAAAVAVFAVLQWRGITRIEATMATA